MLQAQSWTLTCQRASMLSDDGRCACTLFLTDQRGGGGVGGWIFGGLVLFCCVVNVVLWHESAQKIVRDGLLRTALGIL